MTMSWSTQVVDLVVNRLNNFSLNGSSKANCVPLFVCNQKVGILQPAVVTALEGYNKSFLINKSQNGEIVSVSVDPAIRDYTQLSQIFQDVAKFFQDKELFVALKGWRNENYEIASGPSMQALFAVERAVTSVFGMRTYGAHINGIVNHPEKGLCMWIAKRSPNKQTFPGMLDNMVGGGIGTGYSVLETVVKECEEEAGIPKEIARNVVSAGCISYIYEDERGISPEVQFCFDLELPLTFTPVPLDGEVEKFMLCPIQEVKDLIVQPNFKPNCAAVILDFMFRRGIITPDEEANYVQLLQMIHVHF